MATIKGAVGPGGPNDPDDVRAVQERLTRHRRWLDGVPPPPVDGRFSPGTARAIVGFQKDGAALAIADGVVSPNGFTLSRLELDDIPGPQHRIFLTVCWAHPNDVLTDADYAAAASTIGCEAAAIRAVADTEARESPWTPDPWVRPVILFERHKFSAHTGLRYDTTHPDIARTIPGGYLDASREYWRLRRAAMLNEEAALKSASWGLFQILGENHLAAGFATVQSFVDAMIVNRRNHLQAFAGFVVANPSMRRAIKARDWPTFARLYNGRNYAKHDYDGRMRKAYERFARPAAAVVR